MSGYRRNAGLAVAALLIAACGAPAPSASPPPSPLLPGSSASGASAPLTGTPTSQGVTIGAPLLVGQQPGGKAALADTASGPIVSVYQGPIAVPGPLPLASGQPVGQSCPPSPVGIVGSTAVFIGRLQGDWDLVGANGFEPPGSTARIVVPNLIAVALAAVVYVASGEITLRDRDVPSHDICS
jgi:hypothetical protein